MSIVFQNLTSDKKHNSKFFEKVLETAEKELELKNKISLSVNLVGETKIKELNRKYRRKNQPTDVLSFPMAEKFQDLKFKMYDIGDVFICLSIAKNEAKRENISIERKLAQLVTHGFLHLLGYDHERSERDAKEMLGLESKILQNLSL